MIEDATVQRLSEAALAALERAHAPYSGFQVGAALLDAQGGIHTGCNVENASLGLSSCAERNAVFRAVAEGRRDFRALVIATTAEELTPPCGACRQVLVEFAPDLEILLVNTNGQRERHALGELLPRAFLDFRPRS